MLAMFDSAKGRKVSAGIGILFAALLVYSLTKGGYLYLAEVARTKPFFIFTNPAWGLWLILLFGGRQNISVLVTLVMLFSLPLFAATLFYLGYWPVSNYLIGDEAPSPGQLNDWFLTLAYGPYGAQFDYFTIANRLSNFPFYREFMLMVIFSGVVAMVALIPAAHTTLIEILAARRGLDSEASTPWAALLSLLGQMLLMALFYTIVYPLLSFAGTLPLGLNYLAVWTLLLMPLFGLGVARFNRRLNGDDKLGVWMVHYFALVLLALIGAYIWVNIDELVSIANLIGKGEFQPLFSFVFLLSGLFSLYMLRSVRTKEVR
ncbi:MULTISPECIES: hypothetical protein [Shewanella]|uniref:Uncharacterized protein n=1 Tax=Shewanella marisflavi TaxID=260364 RepID=A0ABX5WLW0_9GAMM|nr:MULTISPECIES: hypothetical protein [Shewanella]QDF75568.1 hypothetical protein FGA12_10625 [Shewanella marisflavi]